MDAVVYNLFFREARDNDLDVVIRVRNGAISGKVLDIHSDGVDIITPDDVLFVVGFSQIEYAGTSDTD